MILQPVLVFSCLGSIAASEVLGFHVTQSGNAWQSYDWSKLTMLVVFGSQSTVVAPDAALSDRALAEGVPLIGQMGWACLPASPCTWLANATLRTGRAVAAVQAVRRLGLGGLNIDVEMYNGDAADFTAFVRTIREHADASGGPFRLSVDVSVFAATHPDAGYRLPELAALADHLVLMAYDINYWNPGVPKVASPGAPLDRVASVLRTLLNSSWPQHVPAHKLLLGVPWYGYVFPCNTSGPFLSPCEARGAFPGKQLGYAGAMELRAHAAASAWDPTSATPRFDLAGAGHGPREAVLYEDVRSTSLKYSAAAELGLAGVALWTPNVDYLAPLNKSHEHWQEAMWSAVPSPAAARTTTNERTCTFEAGRPAGAASASRRLTCSPPAAVGDGRLVVRDGGHLSGRHYLDAQLFSYVQPEGAHRPERSPHVRVALLGLGADGGCACVGCAPSKPGDGWERAQRYLHEAGRRGVDLAILPENFRGRPGLPPQCASAAEPVDGPTVGTLSEIAASYRMHIVAPLAEIEAAGRWRDGENGTRYTTAVVLDRNGRVVGEPYRKAFPVLGDTSGHAGEAGLVPASRGLQVYDLDFGRLAVLVCFDVNFAELWHQAAASGADVVAWPSTMVTPDPTSRALAALHKFHILATGFPGEAVGPTGEPLRADTPPTMPLMHLVSLDLDQAFVHYDYNREKVGTLLAEHPEISDALGHRPPFYLLRSLRPNASRVRSLLADYSIETLAQYIARSREGLNVLRAAEQAVPA